jgi:hypothetical protein
MKRAVNLAAPSNPPAGVVSGSQAAEPQTELLAAWPRGHRKSSKSSGRFSTR